MTIRRFLFSLILLLFALSVQASNLVIERSWVEDPSNSLTLPEVREMPQRQMEGGFFGHGYSLSTFWIRLRIDPAQLPQSPPNESLVIRMGPVYQDSIEIFDSLNTKTRKRVTGDLYDWSVDEWQSLNLNFVIPLGKAPRDIWLKLQTKQVLHTSIEVVTTKEAAAADLLEEIIFTLYLSLLLFFMGWGIVSWISHRDELIAWYVIRTACTIAYMFMLLGFGRMFASNLLPAAWLDPLFNISLWTFIASAIWFDSKILKEFQANRWMVFLIKLLVVAWPIELLTMVLGRMYWGVFLNFIVTVVAIVLVFIGALSTKAWSNLAEDKLQLHRVMPKAAFVGIYSLGILFALYDRLSVMGVVPGSKNYLNFILMYPLPMCILMMLLLQLRAYRQNQQRHETQRALEMSRRDAEFERNRRIDDERFISMLTHELKTPISVAKINLDMSGINGKERERIERALKNMTDVVERCRISSAMEDRRLQLNKSTFNVRTQIDETLSLLGRPERVKYFEVNDAFLDSDSQLCGIVISNLLDNALKYSPADSLITVRYEQANSEGKPGLSIIVSNTLGAGALPDPDRLFTKYYRSKTAESKSGSGLGLYISAGIAHILGGTLRYHTAHHQVEFKFWLPA